MTLFESTTFKFSLWAPVWARVAVAFTCHIFKIWTVIEYINHPFCIRFPICCSVECATHFQLLLNQWHTVMGNETTFEVTYFLPRVWKVQLHTIDAVTSQFT